MTRIGSVIERALLILKVDRERKGRRGGGDPGREMTGKIENVISTLGNARLLANCAATFRRDEIAT
jgi:hypothetical protein